MFLLTPGSHSCKSPGSSPSPWARPPGAQAAGSGLCRFPFTLLFPLFFYEYYFLFPGSLSLLVSRTGHYWVVSVALEPLLRHLIWSPPPSTVVHCGSHMGLFKFKLIEMKNQKSKRVSPITRSTGHSSATPLGSGPCRDSLAAPGSPGTLFGSLVKAPGAHDHPGSQSSEGTSRRTDSAQLDQGSPVGPDEPSVPN